MFKNVLIISDNSYLCGKFIEIIVKKKIIESLFSVGISPYSNIEDFKDLKGYTPTVFNLKDSNDIDIIKTSFDLIFSLHCKQIFPFELVNSIKCINIHPGFNPINRGWYPQVFSIIHKLPIGATIHEIDDKLDHGLIIDRAEVLKTSFDTSQSLYNKILSKEIELLEINIENIINNCYKTFPAENEGNLFLKKDFNNLLEIQLNEIVIVRDFIDRIRALTHGNLKNAYFIDENTNKKVFVTINLSPELDG